MQADSSLRLAHVLEGTFIYDAARMYRVMRKGVFEVCAYSESPDQSVLMYSLSVPFVLLKQKHSML